MSGPCQHPVDHIAGSVLALVCPACGAKCSQGQIGNDQLCYDEICPLHALAGPEVPAEAPAEVPPLKLSRDGDGCSYAFVSTRLGPERVRVVLVERSDGQWWVLWSETRQCYLGRSGESQAEDGARTWGTEAEAARALSVLTRVGDLR